MVLIENTSDIGKIG